MTIPEMENIFRSAAGGHDSGSDVGDHSSSASSSSSGSSSSSSSSPSYYYYASSLLVLVENATLPLHLAAQQHPDDPNHHHTHHLGVAATNISAAAGAGGGVGLGEERRWGVLGLLAVIVCSVVGNLLVCLAVCWERRLQNMTNYFLMSLAIADLLVSVVVMPLGMIVELFGHFPLGAEVCVLWVSSDVLLCTASIWHMCTMSMDRFFTLKYPMRYGRNKTKTTVVVKIFFVWVVSVAISSPICVHGFLEPSIVYNNGGVCVPVLKDFVIYGSVFAFYVPLLIMIVTYVLTIRILWSNQQVMKSINQTELRPGLAQMTAQCTGFALPQMPRLMTPVSHNHVSSDTDIFTNTTPHANGGVGHVVQPAGPLPSNILLLSPAGPSPASSFPGLSQQHSCPQRVLQTRQAGSCTSLERVTGGDRRRSRRHRSQGEMARREDSDSEEEEEEDLPSTRLLQEKSQSYRSLCSRKGGISNSSEEFFARANSSSCCSTSASPSTAASRLTPSEKSGSFRERRRRPAKPKTILTTTTHLDVPGHVMFRRGGRLGCTALYSTASDTQIPSSSASCPPQPGAAAFKASFHQSFSGGLGLGLGGTDAKSLEWDRRFFQIQKEMDDCLQDGGQEEEEEGEEEEDGEGSSRGVCLLQDFTSYGEDDACLDSTSAAAVVGAGAGGEGRLGAVPVVGKGRAPTHTHSHTHNHNPGGGRLRGDQLNAVKAALTRPTPPHQQPASPSTLAFTRHTVHRNPRVNSHRNSSSSKSRTKSWSNHNHNHHPHSAPNTPSPHNTSDSDNDRDTSGGSSASDVITIRLYPPTSPTPDSGQQSASEDLTETSALRSVVVSSEADNTQDDSDAMFTNDESPATESGRGDRYSAGGGGPCKPGHKHKRLLKARFRNTLRASRGPMFKHLLSKKTASNERKASKVLGIIFLVFVTLWTPFFIVNILSVTCQRCMEGLTKDMMSIFVWMGYVASLANPIIYTMFNTAFRRTFIRILTCRLTRNTRRMKFSDFPTYPSMTTTMMPSERRGTMTVLLDHRT
ncbi:uncharacterized protein LOC143288739 [Babylonia areolata]|uniref:uncharacterized protein LOC143288739 n=1 Tax=Babylonia areolata TaxID=304850 RepID=UPI003FCFFA61